MCKNYDYIRTIKPLQIRYIKNILLLVVFAAIIATVVLFASPKSQPVNTAPSSGGGNCYDKKSQIEQAKRTYILKRFIS